ncbi:MAG: D-glycero-alpha-D-manno-heptose-1,7-bisphosphate 7-phosphatase [Chitinophagaceae bacterium]
MINFLRINKTWTLFLDRDGVINHEKIGDYVLNRDEFIFYDDIKQALKILSQIFSLIIIVTNQRGIAKGLMTLDDLYDIHNYMLKEINEAGGRIDKIYFCTDLDSESINRKPNAGMAFQAKKDFPQIDFSKSIMVGNKLSDMQFGRNAGIATVFIPSTNPEIKMPHSLIDAQFNNLLEFAAAIHH